MCLDLLDANDYQCAKNTFFCSSLPKTCWTEPPHTSMCLVVSQLFLVWVQEEKTCQPNWRQCSCPHRFSKGLSNLTRNGSEPECFWHRTRFDDHGVKKSEEWRKETEQRGLRDSQEPGQTHMHTSVEASTYKSQSSKWWVCVRDRAH